MDQLPRLGKRELICLLSFTCNYVVFVWRGFLFLWVLGMGYVILLWHSLSLPYNYFLSHTNWGADRTVLLQLYRSLIRSKLDYRPIVYGSARKSYLMMLDTVHHQGLRLALGAFRTSPVESLYVEAEEPSLYFHREKLALQYAIRLAANPSNPTFKVTFPPHISQDIIDLYDNKPNAIRSFGLRFASFLTSANINKEQIETHSISEIPSWCIR